MAETSRRPTVMSKIERACGSISDAKVQTSSIEYTATPTAPGPVSRVGFIVQHDETCLVMRTKLKAGSSKVSVVRYEADKVLLVVGRPGGFGQAFVKGDVPLGTFKGLTATAKGLAQFANSEDKYTLFVGSNTEVNAIAEDAAGKKAKASKATGKKVSAKSTGKKTGKKRKAA